jgi:acyl carrier protein
VSDTASLQQRVLSLLSEEMQLPVSDPATDLIDEGVLDSLVFVDLIARLEETFSFEIDLADLEIDELRSVEQIARYVASATGTPEAEPVLEAAPTV